MKIKHDSTNDAIYFKLSDAKIEDSESLVNDDFTVVYDRDRNVVGLEILNASKNELLEKLILAAITSLRETAAEDHPFNDPVYPLSYFGVSDAGD